MELALPPSGVTDHHFVLHLGLYPEWSKLTAVTYNLSKAHHQTSKPLFSPRIMAPPASEWEVIQSLEFGLDLLSRRLWYAED